MIVAIHRPGCRAGTAFSSSTPVALSPTSRESFASAAPVYFPVWITGLLIPLPVTPHLARI